MESVQPVLFSSPIYSRKEFFDGPRGTIPETGERSKKENQRNQCRGREAPHRRRRKVPARGCARRQRMGKGTSSRRRAHGQGHHRARYRATSPGHECKARPVLRRRIPVRAGSGKPAEDGLQQRRIDGRRVEGLAGSGFADRARLAESMGSQNQYSSVKSGDSASEDWMPRIAERWLLFKYIGGEFTPLSKPVKKPGNSETRRRYSTPSKQPESPCSLSNARSFFSQSLRPR